MADSVRRIFVEFITKHVGDEPGMIRLRQQADQIRSEYTSAGKAVTKTVDQIKAAKKTELRLEVDNRPLKEFLDEAKDAERTFKQLSSSVSAFAQIDRKTRKAAGSARDLIRDARKSAAAAIDAEEQVLAATKTIEDAKTRIAAAGARDRMKIAHEVAAEVGRAQDVIGELGSDTEGRRRDTIRSFSLLSKEVGNAGKSFANTAEKAQDWSSGIEKILSRVRQVVPLLRGLGILVGGALVPAVAALVGSLTAAAIGFAGLATAGAAALGPILAVTLGLFSRISAITEAMSAREKALQADRKDARAGVSAEAQATQDLITARHALRNATEGIGTAEQALADARADAGRAIADAQQREIDAASELQDANRDLGVTTREAYRAIEDSAEQASDAVRDLQHAQLDLAESRLGVREARAELEEFARSAGASESTIRRFFEKFSDVYVNPKAVRKTLASFAADAGIGQDESLEFEKLTLRLRQALLDEKDAADGVGDSRRDLADARREEARFLREGIQAYEPYTAAVDRSAQAQRDYADAVRDANELTKDGIDNAPTVISAQRALRDAHEAQRTAQFNLTKQQRATNAVMKDGSAAMQRYKDLRDKLSGSEQGFLDQLVKTKKGLTDLLRGATDPILKSLTDALKSLKDLGPIAGVVFAGMGKAAADNIRDLAKMFSTDQFAGFFAEIGNLATTLTRALGGEALRGFLQIVLNVTRAFGPALGQLAQDFAGFMTKAAESTKNIDPKNVKLWVDSLKGIVNFGAQVVNVLEAFARVAAPFGNELIKFVTEGLQGLADWFRSDEGREETKRFFEETIPFVKELLRFVKRFGVALLKIFQFLAPGLTDLFAGLNALLGILDVILDFANKLPTWFKRLAFLVAPFVGIWKGGLLAIQITIRGVTLAVGQIVFAVTALGALVRSALGKVVGAFEWLIDKVKSVLGISSPSTVFIQIGKDVIRGFIAGIQAMLGFLGNVAADVGRRVVNGLRRIVGAAFGLGRRVVSFLANGVRSAFQGLLSVGRFVVGAIRDGAVAVAHFMTNAARFLFRKIRTFFTEAWHGLIDIGKSIVKGLAQGIEDGAHWAVDAITALANSMVKIAETILGIASPSKVFAGIGENMMKGLAQGIEQNKKAPQQMVNKLFDEMAVGSVFGMGDAPGKLPWVKQQWRKYPMDSAYIRDLIERGGPGSEAARKYGIARDIAGGPIQFGPWKQLLKGQIIKEIFDRIPKPDIPWMAGGGIATGATLAGLGEAGREAILPLTRRTFRQLGESIAAAMVPRSSSFMPVGMRGNEAFAGATGPGRGFTVENINLPPAPPAAVPDARHQAAQLARELRRRG